MFHKLSRSLTAAAAAGALLLALSSPARAECPRSEGGAESGAVTGTGLTQVWASVQRFLALVVADAPPSSPTGSAGGENQTGGDEGPEIDPNG